MKAERKQHTQGHETKLDFHLRSNWLSPHSPAFFSCHGALFQPH